MPPRHTRCGICRWEVTAVNLASAVDAAVEHLEAHPTCNEPTNDITINVMRRLNIMDKLKQNWLVTDLGDTAAEQVQQALAEVQQAARAVAATVTPSGTPEVVRSTASVP